MSNETKNSITDRFLTVYGPKPHCNELFNPEDDTTDQRSPVNNPLDLFNQFVVPDDVMDELDNESVDDFENDIYDYEDRSDLGEDIALAASLDLTKRRQAKSVSKKSVKSKDIEEKETDEEGE